MTDSAKPIVGLTMGDPAGIGPEIICKMFADRTVYGFSRPLVIGDSGCLNEGMKVGKVSLQLNSIKKASEAKFVPGTIDVIDLHNVDIKNLKMGEPQAMAGKACVEYIKKAVELATIGEIDAIVTGPINKKAMNMGGYKYAGHTELLADLTNTKDFAMLLVTGPLKVIHVSTHVSLVEAIRRVQKERVTTVIKLADQALRELGVAHPRVAVAGLNPHAGEDGMFGNEEIETIAPAVEAAKKMGIDVSGPIAPDTIFLRTKKGEFDVVVAMYHDQGHVAIKMLGFELGVNVSIGLPIIRTSVDHGTAYRRAGLKLGTGDPTSLIEATRLAAQIAKSRTRR
ncbi:MAG TPA: 4-hydroxythreonine-4-phosphate dehydrogenase PdxA [Candidatus Acidoferrum sp.]|nr:4-hydroxythreonine-4-phosphate dehydrogenase PdxA [Candidatus Acidoferrum sp.]